MTGTRDFDELPEDMRNVIWGFINEQANAKELANWSIVSKSWNTFFKEKLTDLHLLYFLTKDKEAGNKITIEDLTTAINIYLRHHVNKKEKIVDLFIALKNLETNLIVLENAEDKQSLKIHKQDLMKLLIDKFGVMGLIHRTALQDALSDSPNINGLVPICALEKLLQQDANQYASTLALLNMCAEKGYFVLQFEDMPYEGIFIKMVNNQLGIDLTADGQVQSYMLSDALSLQAVTPAELNEPIKAFLAQLDNRDQKNIFSSKQW